MSLRDRLARQIAAGGPLDVSQFMTACLHDPAEGYYATRPALGAEGDFITAPLVSQMFGELIGLWAVEAWDRLGRPSRLRLIEAGPGDGVLMEDMLRAARLSPEFLEAVEVWLVEVSPPLIARQKARLGDTPRWARSLADVPDDLPALLVANELLDCLPARQFVRQGGRWLERLVGEKDGMLAFGLARTPAVEALPPGPEGAVLEVSTAQATLGSELGRRFARGAGAALLIDYGRAEPGYGDTLQALSRHRKVDPLQTAGEADLTVHADFPAVLAAARKAGAEAAPVLTQGELLRRLGVFQRAEALARRRPDQAELIFRQLERLTDSGQMGEIFKAACIHSAGWSPPGFEGTA